MRKICSLFLLMGMLICVISGCSSEKIERYSIKLIEDHMFDTIVEFIVFTDDEEVFTQLTEELKAQYAYYHKLYDKYNDIPEFIISDL